MIQQAVLRPMLVPILGDPEASRNKGWQIRGHTHLALTPLWGMC